MSVLSSPTLTCSWQGGEAPRTPQTIAAVSDSSRGKQPADVDVACQVRPLHALPRVEPAAQAAAPRPLVISGVGPRIVGGLRLRKAGKVVLHKEERAVGLVRVEDRPAEIRRGGDVAQRGEARGKRREL